MLSPSRETRQREVPHGRHPDLLRRDHLRRPVVWIVISTAAADVFVYFIADPLLYWTAPTFFAYLDQANQNVKDAEHIEAVPMNAY
ncbi:hypothetical protein DIPPA_25403 [Diplonema papillatum]|nr:hypothetical protein DIPPA_25403 [Diplonema papillatum]